MIHFIWIFQASANQRNLDVGANIFIGNLDPEVDEKLLYDTFSAFGVILQTPKVSILSKNFIWKGKRSSVEHSSYLHIALKRTSIWYIKGEYQRKVK